MIASVVLQNLAYPAGAVVLAVVIGIAVAVRHRRPKSLEANVDSFNRGLQALSPEVTRKGRHRSGPAHLEGPTRGTTYARPIGRVFTHDETEAETG